MINNRDQVTEQLLSAKVAKGIKWSQVANALGLSKEWTTAACFGQSILSREQAGIVGELFGLSDDAVAGLQIAPY
ncbi:MAG: cyanate lyase [Motiliproteus sp.]|jgi:cyanate lyase